MSEDPSPTLSMLQRRALALVWRRTMFDPRRCGATMSWEQIEDLQDHRRAFGGGQECVDIIRDVTRLYRASWIEKPLAALITGDDAYLERWCYEGLNTDAEQALSPDDLVAMLQAESRERAPINYPNTKTVEPAADTDRVAQVPTSADLIAAECDALREMLLEKNAQYGDSALNPLRVASRASTEEQIRVRIDDKLSRIARGNGEGDEDAWLDLIGYVILLRVHMRKQASAEAG